MAGHRQGVPRRVFAPHRAARVGSPGGLPFLSQPRRASWGVAFRLPFTPTPTPRSVHRSHNGLPALVDVNMLHPYPLLARFALQPLPHRDLFQVQS
jgi:hypothetical protein